MQSRTAVRLGIDVGGTTIKVGRYDGADMRLVARTQRPTPGGRPRRLESTISQCIDDVCPTPEDISSVGLVAPGIVDPAEGTVRNAVNLGIGSTPWPVRARLWAHLGRPVRVENDSRAAALGAASVIRSTEPAPSVLYLGIGTGVAAGLVIGESLYRGSLGFAGEIGHLALGRAETNCRCGRQGCVEAIVGGPAIADRWPTAEPARDLFDRCAADDRSARQVAEPIIDTLAQLITWLAATVDPAIVVLGGGVGSSTPNLRRLVARRLARPDLVMEGHTPTEIPSRLRTLSPAAEPGILGAALLTDLEPNAETNSGRGEQ